ncbi:MAG: CvpA family protein [Candidatus Dormibacteraeota bacterium]|nr:CvpA family protein [Candidatus Dormibacteraeota bacterium]
MNWLDVLPIVLLIVYVALGFVTGVLRRLIGLVALYLAFVGATNMGLQAGGIMQQSSTLETPDARIYGFFGIVIVVIVIVEGAAQLASSQIQVGAVVFNRVLGVLIGALTAILLSVLITHELVAAGNPFGGGALDPLQQSIRTAVRGSQLAVPLANAVGKPIVTIFQPALPGDPQIYFSQSPVS